MIDTSASDTASPVAASVTIPEMWILVGKKRNSPNLSTTAIAATTATAIRVKGDPAAVRRPAGHAVLVHVVGQLAAAGAVRADDENILLLS